MTNELYRLKGNYLWLEYEFKLIIMSHKIFVATFGGGCV